MAICDKCGAYYDENEVRIQMEIDALNPDFFECNLCMDCYENIFSNQEEGYYFEECEECGKKFDYFRTIHRCDQYDEVFNETGLILCEECYNSKL